MSEELIHESPRSRIFLVSDGEEGRSDAVVKMLNDDFPKEADIAQFYNQAEIIKDVDIPGVRKIFGRTKIKNKHALKMEYFEGVSLREQFRHNQDNLSMFLRVAVAVSAVLDEVHLAGITHKDINPGNILVSPDTLDISLIDFELSSRSVSKNHDLRIPTHLLGTISYCSPEQTGRINRAVDRRSDLYSLGATFYELLSGRPPFLAKDNMELVHAHIAQVPQQINEVNKEVPLMVAKIIAKLLEKNPEDRYQTAFGLQHDLAICLQRFGDSGSIESFELGSRNQSRQFSIRDKLYGRDKEVKRILQTFDTCVLGGTELLLINGYSGTGKSALVHEVHKPITLAKGFYIEGKYEQFQDAVPYSGILQALSALIDLILLEDEENLRKIAARVQAALGAEGKVLTNLIPSLEALVGAQPEIPDIGGEDARRRFNYVIDKFFAALCDASHPIVLFLDDIQWADAASFRLLHKLLTGAEINNFLCIAAYRNNEVPEGHSLHSTIVGLQAAGVSLDTIEVDNLSKADISQLIADAFDQNTDSTEIADLTDLIIEKTQGNAFFATRFLQSIEEDGLIFYDRDKNAWDWDLAVIREQNITDNVVEFLTHKLRTLPEETQEVLKISSALGTTIDANLFDIIYHGDSESRTREFARARDEGLIFESLQGQYRFAHDRIVEAVYSLIPEDEKAVLHQQIAQQMERNFSSTEIDSRLFEIVNHYNRALKGSDQADADKAITSDALVELQHLAELNYRAAVKAKTNSAFRLSLDYLLRAEDLLSEDAWQTMYSLCYDIHREITEVSYLCAQYDMTHKYFAIVDQQAQTLMDRVRVYEVKINAHKADNDLPSAIDTGLEALSLLNRKIPRHPTKAQVAMGLIASEIRLRNVTSEKVLNLPIMEKPEHIAAMRIMVNISPSAYWAEPNMLPILSFELIAMSLKHGLNELSGFIFAGYGIIMCGVLGRMRRGQAYGELGLKLLEKFDSKEWVTQIVDPVYALILHWNKHVDLSLQPLRDSFYTGLETGENEFACVNANIYCIHAFLSGKPLELLEKETETFSNSFLGLKQETQHHYNEITRQAMRCFLGLDDDPTSLVGSAFNAEEMIPIKEQRDDKAALFIIHFNAMLISYFFGKYQQALEHADRAAQMEEAVLSKYEIPNLYFYRSLAALGLAATETNSRARLPLLKIAKKGLKKLTFYAKYAPENYLHKSTIIKSQVARLQNKMERSRSLADLAIKQANQQGFLHEEALMYELAGRSYMENELEDLGAYYLNNAFSLYQQWGSRSKMDQLLKEYPRYLSDLDRRHSVFQNETHSKSQGPNNLTISSTSFAGGANLDVDTLVKASLSVSSQVELSKLLKNLLNVVIENAGAQKGALVLQRDEGLFLEAVTDISNDFSEVLMQLPLEKQSHVPITTIRYISRSMNSFISNSFSTQTQFTQDDYLDRVEPESMMGLPVINQGNLVGVLYLENNLTKNAFTPERVRLLSLLSSQMAVSIDNAILYQNLEQKVAERTVELAAEKQKSDDLLANILPRQVAQELKENGHTEPKYFSDATVMFTDFVGFTKASTKMSTKQLVDTLDYCFKRFDDIVASRGIEKIKTIGDSYMCAAGVPASSPNHAADMVSTALEFLQVMEDFNKMNVGNDLPRLEVRIGMHSGPLVAGVVGTKKFAYDIWGNTVNEASRLEAASEPGKINISEQTYQLIGDQFECEFRGSKMAKNLGHLNMYFVHRELELKKQIKT